MSAVLLHVPPIKLSCAARTKAGLPCKNEATHEPSVCAAKLVALIKKNKRKRLTREDQQALRSLVFCHVHYQSCRKITKEYKDICSEIQKNDDLTKMQTKLFKLVPRKILLDRTMIPLHHWDSEISRGWRKKIYKALPDKDDTLKKWTRLVHNCIQKRQRFNETCVHPHHNDVVHERFMEILIILEEEIQRKLKLTKDTEGLTTMFKMLSVSS